MERKATGSRIGWTLFGLSLLIGAAGVLLIAKGALWGRALIAVAATLILVSIYTNRRPQGRRGE